MGDLASPKFMQASASTREKKLEFPQTGIGAPRAFSRRMFKLHMLDVL